MQTQETESSLSFRSSELLKVTECVLARVGDVEEPVVKGVFGQPCDPVPETCATGLKGVQRTRPHPCARRRQTT